MPKTKSKKKKRISKEQPKEGDFLSSNSAIELFYGFLVFISVLYGFLIWQSGRAIEKEIIYNPPLKINRISSQEKELRNLVGEHPIEKMVPYISRQNREIAAFVLAIAKKESNWGKYSPKKDGRECFNYWGYRGAYNQTRSGYACFDSPKQAVEVISGRISELVSQEIDTPEEMVVWKCGFSCEGHSPEGVKKWIADVGFYYKKLYIK